jgi:hypothetical protein
VFIGDSIHKRSVFRPSFLLPHRDLVLPRGSLLVDHDKVWHFFLALAFVFHQARKNCLNGLDESISGPLPTKAHYFPNQEAILKSDCPHGK